VHQLAAADLTRLRQDMKPSAFVGESEGVLADGGYPRRFEFEWTTSQNESWGLPIVEGRYPDAGTEWA